MIDLKNKDKELLDFIDRSPTAFHTVKNISDILLSAGFTRLYEDEKWKTQKGGKYFVIRNSSSVIAFVKGEENAPFMISASHSDSPALRVKGSDARGTYLRLDVERYGGAIHYTWFDRPLSLAGRVILKTENGVEERLLNVERDLLIIPSVAPHLSRSVNDGFSPNPAVDLLPLFSVDKTMTAKKFIANELSVAEDSVLSHDLFVYARDKAKLVGLNSEFILSPRLDDLECVYTSLVALLMSKPTDATKVLAVFDNEEVGSATKQGAASGFLADVLERISADRESYIASLASSFMVSADNAHAKHPAHPELSDPQNAPVLSGGVVIKHNANQRYTTDAYSEAVFTEICSRAGATVQHYANRADILGGSTLGSISNTKVAIASIDIGLAQLAMHSAVETASRSDALEMIKALTQFYSTTLRVNGEKTVIK